MINENYRYDIYLEAKIRRRITFECGKFIKVMNL